MWITVRSDNELRVAMPKSSDRTNMIASEKVMADTRNRSKIDVNSVAFKQALSKAEFTARDELSSIQDFVRTPAFVTGSTCPAQSPA